MMKRKEKTPRICTYLRIYPQKVATLIIFLLKMAYQIAEQYPENTEIAVLANTNFLL